MTPSDTGSGYKQIKAKIGRSKVRSWHLEPFKIPSRQDDLTLNHWRRKNDEGKTYPFAKFNKVSFHSSSSALLSQGNRYSFFCSLRFIFLMLCSF